MLVLDDFRKIYNSQVILSIPNLKFEPGIHWIKGANGAGKSTLFKSIAGIIPFEGDITLNDLRLKKDHVSYRKVVNYSEAEPLYPGFLTAKDLTRFVGTAKGSSPEQQDYYVQRFGISSYFEKACDTYSSGMLKKLSLAMAFLGNPKVIILDEPLITLDEETRKNLLDMIRSTLSKEVIFLISSHQEVTGIEVIKHSYCINNGTLCLEHH